MNKKDVIRLVKLANLIKKGGYIMQDMSIKSLLDEEQKKQKKDIITQLKNIDNSLKVISPKEKEEYNVNLTKLGIRDINDDLIKQKATENLGYFKAKSTKDIEDKYENEKNVLNSNLQFAKQNLEEKRKAVSEKAEQSKENVKDNLINKNVVRGSIYNSFMTDIEKSELANLNNLKDENDKKISTLKTELESLDIKKQEALNDFSINYAIKLQDEIDGIKKEIEKYNNDAIQYNNKIIEKEEALKRKYDESYQNYVKAVDERNKGVMDFLGKYGYSQLDNKITEQKYDLVKNYLNTLSKDSALMVLTEDNEFLSLLGEDDYDKLLTAVKGRKA